MVLVRADALRPPTSAAFCRLHRSGTCRSCPHQDMPLNLQLSRKQQRVAQMLAAAPNPVPADAWLPPVASAPERFRNKAKMVVSGRAAAPVLGILGPDGGIDLRSCPLHMSAIEDALPVLSRAVSRLGIGPYDVDARRGELKHLLVTASPDGDLMVRWVLRSHRHVEQLRDALPELRRELPTLAVMSANIQPVHQAIIEGEEEIILTDDVPWGDRLLMRLRLPELVGSGSAPDGISAGRTGGAERAGGPRRATGTELLLFLPTRSFFQTNTGVAERLYATAAHWAQDLDRQAEVWDLFCGVGGFALVLAGSGRRVLGVEVSEPAIRGARESAALMSLASPGVRFGSRDARIQTPGAGGWWCWWWGVVVLGGGGLWAPVVGGGGASWFCSPPHARILTPGAGTVPDLLVVNPPRRGIGAELAGRIDNSGVGRMLYSSCNPMSLAADLEAMPSLRVRRAQLFDMFPHTDHAEVLVELA